MKVGDDPDPAGFFISLKFLKSLNQPSLYIMKVGDDPDPAPFLFVNEEIKARIAAKVYDPKRSAYVPHPEEKYCEVRILINIFSVTLC